MHERLQPFDTSSSQWQPQSSTRLHVLQIFTTAQCFEREIRNTFDKSVVRKQMKKYQTNYVRSPEIKPLAPVGNYE